MSTPNGPARRRRIAGEATPAKKTAKKATAKKAPAKKTVTPPVVKKAAAKKAPTSQTPVAKAPTKKAAAKKAPTPTKGPTKKASSTKAPAADASAPEVAAADVVDVEATTEAPTTATAPAVPTARVSVPRPGAGRPVAAPPRPVAPSAPRRTLPLAVLVPLAVVTVAALAFGVVFGYHGYSTWHAKKDYRSSATQAAARAGTAAETIFSYSYTKASLSKHATESKSFMTAKFKKEFDKISPALTQLATQGDYQVKTVTRNAAPMECGSSCSPDKANILVFFDQARSKGSASPTVFGNRVVVSMKKQDGTWLVDNITAL